MVARMAVNSAAVRLSTLLTAVLIISKCTKCASDPAPTEWPALNRTSGRVIPATVRASSVDISGPWYAFNISWQPTPVPNKQVYYRVLLTFGNTEVTKETYEPYLTVANVSGVRPFSRMKLMMQSCNYWGCSQRAERDLITPMAPPSPPQKPRGFITFRRMPLDVDYSVQLELHWWRPLDPNGRLKNYSVIYQETESIWRRHSVDPENYTFPLENVTKNHIYKLRVSACNAVGCSDQSPIVLLDTSRENPVPQLITSNDSKISLFLPDAQRSTGLHDSSAIALTFEAQESALYLLDRSRHIVKLPPKKEHEIEVLDVAGRGKSIGIDWVGRDLYWMEQVTSGLCEIRTYNIDSGGRTSNRVLQMDTTGAYLAVQPSQRAIFWSVAGPGGFGSIKRCNMDGSDTRTVVGSFRHGRTKRVAPGCNCPVMAVTSVFGMDHSLINRSEIYLVEKATHSIWASDTEGCRCRLVVNATGQAEELGMPPDSIAVDHMYLYWSNSKQGELHSVLKSNGQTVELVKKLEGVKHILAYGSHLQRFPAPKCLRPTDYKERPQILTNTNTSFTLVLKPWKPDPECSMSLPHTRYIVSYRKASGTIDIEPCSKTNNCKEKTTYDLKMRLDNLEANTYYVVEVQADNFHTRHERRHQVPSHTYRTGHGVPWKPTNVTANARTPERVDVSWRSARVGNGPQDDIQYDIQYWATPNARPKMVRNLKPKVKNGVHTYTIDSLTPGTTYNLQVVAFRQFDRAIGGNHSLPVEVDTFPAPEKVVAVDKGEEYLTVSWRAPSDGSIVRHALAIAVVIGEPWSRAGVVQQTKPGAEYNETFIDLEPNTDYGLYINATYQENIAFTWPHNANYTETTLRGRPGKPKRPQIEGSEENAVVTWSAPKDGGNPINQYMLNAKRNDELNWTLVYNGTETQWTLTGLKSQATFVFTVTAHNSKGRGETSDQSTEVVYRPAMPFAVSVKAQLTIILAVFFAVIFLVIALLAALILGTRFLKRHKPAPVDVVSASPRREGDRELATLRILPSSLAQTNALYAINIVPTEADVAALPHFRRERLRLTKFLGSGAFGEVFEGTATEIEESEQPIDTKVAVKTLRKGASNAEKEEFLKEALLMQNFRHTHILRLLGVCLENDPQFIILELMEGGDLLSYLRNARPSTSRSSRLTVTDMVAMCTDVAKGCKYLEDMHFVHRDLAARNCLVSSLDVNLRVVKIGDFGLARDIYKNDYYRKEGEGLLPVRWMSPESLIDGVFTTYSDVWAFGVLMWEVLTLGQQPYPARTNIEVLNYVRGGGLLDRPDSCPDDMYSAMLKCWCFSPSGRPSFNYLLSELENIIVKGVEPTNHYTSTDMSGPKRTRNAQPLARDATTASYVGPQLASQASNSQLPYADRARPTDGTVDPSPYLQPVATPGGQNKYLELLGSNSVPNPPANANANAPTPRHLRYAHSSDGIGLDSDNPSTLDSGADSPEVPPRYLAWARQPLKHALIDYAQLALSDDADTAPDTDNETGSAHTHPVGATSAAAPHIRRHHRPTWGHHRSSGGSHVQQQYAHVASTDSDTDTEICIDRSKQKSKNIFSSQPTTNNTLTTTTTTTTPAATVSTLTPNTASAIPMRRLHGNGSCVVDVNKGGAGESVYTVDGYLAPRSLLGIGKQGQSSSSINSNLSNLSIGQSSC